MEKLKNIWYKQSDKLRFLFVGGFNAGISYLIYMIFVYILGEKYYQISLALAWALSSVVSFTTQRKLVFNSDGNLIKQYLNCCITWFFSYLINAIILWAFVDRLKLNVYWAQIFATICSAIFTYIIFKLIIFKVRK
ncbi:MAG: GtrA family protein [bacterium]|nr:GtrA family protein [bacterium]